MIILVFSTISLGFGLQSSKGISAYGTISYWPRVDVTVNAKKIIGINNLSLGFQLDFEWKRWRDNAVRRQLAADAGFKLVRIFDWRSQSGASPDPCLYWNETAKTGVFDWTDLDLLVSRIFEIGAEPLITLGGYDMQPKYLPTGMATNPVTGLPYPESWAAYCRTWVKHFKDVGLPVRFYEIVNEAWHYWYSNWVYNETRLRYFLELFNSAYIQMHEENPDVLISNDAATYRKFVDFWLKNGGKLDYISFHKYDCDGMHMEDSIPLSRAETRHFVSDAIWYGVNDVRKLWLNAYGVYLPAINSESNFAAICKEGTDPRIQKTVGAVWTALMLKSCILNNVQYTIYYSFGSSASYEQTRPSGGLGFGMINLDNNMPWYPYYVQKLIGNNLAIGDQLVETLSSSDDISALAWLHDEVLNILIISKVDQPKNIFLQGVSGEMKFAKIDDTVSYLSPSLQIGKITPVEPLSVTGYAVALVQIVS